jgi:hypothetical protein
MRGSTKEESSCEPGIETNLPWMKFDSLPTSDLDLLDLIRGNPKSEEMIFVPSTWHL